MTCLTISIITQFKVDICILILKTVFKTSSWVSILYFRIWNILYRLDTGCFKRPLRMMWFLWKIVFFFPNDTIQGTTKQGTLTIQEETHTKKRLKLITENCLNEGKYYHRYVFGTKKTWFEAQKRQFYKICHLNGRWVIKMYYKIYIKENKEVISCSAVNDMNVH